MSKYKPGRLTRKEHSLSGNLMVQYQVSPLWLHRRRRARKFVFTQNSLCANNARQVVQITSDIHYFNYSKQIICLCDR